MRPRVKKIEGPREEEAPAPSDNRKDYRPRYNAANLLDESGGKLLPELLRKEDQTNTSLRAAAVLLAITGLAMRANAQYTVTDLTPAGYTSNFGNGIASGMQVGSGAPTASVISHALLWSGTAGSVVDLHPSSYTGGSVANGLSGGTQVGYGAISLGGATHALKWTGTAASFVDLNGSFSMSGAHGVSGSAIVGFGTVSSGDNHAVLWAAGTVGSVVDLNPTGSPGSIAYGVDGSHQVGVQLLSTGSPNHALLWSGTAGSVVDLNPTGYGTSIAWGVSGSVQVGQAIPTGAVFSHALMWSGTAASFVDLNPTGFDGTVARGIAGGEEVGWGMSDAAFGATHALVWGGSADSAIDLNSFLPFKSTLSHARGIDAAGNIIGDAIDPDDGTMHVVMWSPVPEPGPGSLLTFGAGVALAVRWRKKLFRFGTAH